MNGAIPLLPLYAIKPWAGTIIYLYLLSLTYYWPSLFLKNLPNYDKNMLFDIAQFIYGIYGDAANGMIGKVG